MTFEETLQYLYTRMPLFQQQGASAYKPGLGTSIALDNYLGNPHQAYQTIHIAGTNGKGSVSHLLAAILQQSGYKTGLYTSPHLVDFRERIRVNGKKISKEYVVRFVERYRAAFEPLYPSFFELTSGMAFAYFQEEDVDVAVIETGLGGRLDSTNLLTPILSIITNISPDHTQFLGNTVIDIAKEKAGIIKPGVPVVIGDVEEPEIQDLFIRRATDRNSPLYFSTQESSIQEACPEENGGWKYQTEVYGTLYGELGGCVQERNARTVLTAVRVLTDEGIAISPEAVRDGFAHVTQLTGLMGRWQLLQDHPPVICDTGHNIGSWKYLAPQLIRESRRHRTLRLLLGFVNDKEIESILRLLPRNACYYFTQASIERALPAEELKRTASTCHLEGDLFPTVTGAVERALADADPSDFIFIGGSTFVVAEAIPLFLPFTE